MKNLVLLAVIFLGLLKVADPRTFLHVLEVRHVPVGDGCVVVTRCTTDRDRRIWWKFGDDDEVPAESVSYPEGENFVASTRRFVVNKKKTITCIGVDEVRNDDPERETLTVDPSEGCVIMPSTTFYPTPSSSPDPTPSSSPDPTPSSSPDPTPSSSPDPTPSSSPDPTPSSSPDPTPSSSPDPTPSSSPNPTPSSSLCGTGCIAGTVTVLILLGAVGLVVVVVAVVYTRRDSSAPKNSAPKGHPDLVEQPAPEGSCDATQDETGCASSKPGLAQPEETQVEKQDDPGLNGMPIPPPPPPPPVTETPLTPPASSQKYQTYSKQLQEILEARDKKIRGRHPASVSNATCQLESTGSTGEGPESQLSEMNKQFGDSECMEASDSQTTSGVTPVFGAPKPLQRRYQPQPSVNREGATADCDVSGMKTEVRVFTEEFKPSETTDTTVITMEEGTSSEAERVQ